MIKVYCIIGRTGAGKDTIARRLSKKTGIPMIVSVTDAEIRSDQKNGREHWFVSKDRMDSILEDEEIIAYTKINGNRYCTTADQFKKDCIYVIDPDGYKFLKEKDLFTLVPIVITAPRSVREERCFVRKGFDFRKRDISESPEFDSFYESSELLRVKELSGHDAFFSNIFDPEKCVSEIINAIGLNLS